MKTPTEKMQALLARIPRGKVTTYKEVAHAIGTRGYRYVGQLLNKNPDPDTFPCCKVVSSDGKLGGFAHGPEAKIRRLAKEGIQVRNGKIENFKEVFFSFPKK